MAQLIYAYENIPLMTQSKSWNICGSLRFPHAPTPRGKHYSDFCHFWFILRDHVFKSNSKNYLRSVSDKGHYCKTKTNIIKAANQMTVLNYFSTSRTLSYHSGTRKKAAGQIRFPKEQGNIKKAYTFFLSALHPHLQKPDTGRVIQSVPNLKIWLSLLLTLRRQICTLNSKVKQNLACHFNWDFAWIISMTSKSEKVISKPKKTKNQVSEYIFLIINK